MLSYSKRHDRRHNPITLGRAHVAMVTAATVLWNSDAVAKITRDGEEWLQAIMRRDPATADAFMDQLFTQADLPENALFLPAPEKDEDGSGEAKADELLLEFISAFIAQWLKRYIRG